MEEVTDDDDTETDRKRKKEREDRKKEKKKQKQQTKKNKKARKAREKKEKEKRRIEKEAIEKAAKASSPSKAPQQIASADILAENILPGAGSKRTRSKHMEKNGEGKQIQADTEHKETDGGKGSTASSGKGHSPGGRGTGSKRGGADSQRETRIKELWARLRPGEEKIEGGGGTGGDDGAGGEGDEGDRERLAGKAKGGDNDKDWTEPGGQGGNRGGKGKGRRGRGEGKTDNSTPSMLDYVARSPILGVRRDREPGTTPEDRSKKAKGRPPIDPGLKLDMEKFPPGVSSLVFHPNPERGGEPPNPEAARLENEALDSQDDYSMFEEHSEQQYTDYGSMGEGGDDY